jgi:integrase
MSYDDDYRELIEGARDAMGELLRGSTPDSWLNLRRSYGELAQVLQRDDQGRAAEAHSQARSEQAARMQEHRALRRIWGTRQSLAVKLCCSACSATSGKRSARRPLVAFYGADKTALSDRRGRDRRVPAAPAREVSHRTAQKILVLLFGLLKYAQRRRCIATNPAEDAERVTVKRRTEFAGLSPEEVQALARKAATEQEAALFTVAAFTGLRMGELRALRWRDVDFANRLVHVRRSVWRTAEGTPKSGKARSVPLIDLAAVALDGLSRRARFTGPADYVFASVTGGKLYDGDMRDGLYAALEAAGIERDRGTGKLFVFHDLRHTFGTLAVQAFPLSDVQAYMGHAASTQRCFTCITPRSTTPPTGSHGSSTTPPQPTQFSDAGVTPASATSEQRSPGHAHYAWPSLG